MRVLLAAAAALVLASSAGADGLPVLNVDVGASGVAAPGGTLRYVTVTVGKQTVVEAIRRGGGQIVRLRTSPGVWTIPAVAYDRSASGLSADRRTLVLIEPRTSFPRARTRFLVLNAAKLSSAGVVALNGDFSFDAISPNGRVMYLIGYDPRELGEYEVRAYDMRRGRLLPKPIVDPEEPDEEMYGAPVTRTMGAGSRWAYTLYNSAEHPFVHALDTARRTAVCIDLDNLTQVWGASLELRGPNLHVIGRRGRLLATIDTRTHELTRQIPSAARRRAAAEERAQRLAAAAAARRAADAEADAGTSWLPLVLPTAALLLLAAAGRRAALRRRGAASSAPRSAT
jgi:hypothetical protein